MPGLFTRFGATLITALGATTALAGPPSAESLRKAQLFGAPESVSQMRLSPDGNRVVYITPVPDGQIVYVADLAAGGAPKPAFGITRAEGGIWGCSWVTSDRVACKVGMIRKEGADLLGFTRIMAANADGSQMKIVSDTGSSRSQYRVFYGGDVIDSNVPGKPGSILMDRWFVPDVTLGRIIKSEAQGLGVDEVDTTSLRRKNVEGPRLDAAEYISDGQGNVRIMATQVVKGTGYVRENRTYFYRKPASREWLPLSVVDTTQEALTGFMPALVDSASNSAYGFDTSNGFSAVFRITLDGTDRRELVLGRNDVDVDRIVTIGRSRRVVGASYATDRRQIDYFDPEIKKLSASLSKALPGNPGVYIVDSSADENKLLISVSTDTNPGVYYLFDKTARKLEEILPVRGELAGQNLATMKPVTYPAADGTMIPGYLTIPAGSTGKGLPVIVMPHGGPSSRDEWGFDWLVQYFAARGFAVLQPNFRGSAGYGPDWYRKNGFKSWRTSVGDINDAGRWLQSQGIAAPGKVAIFGWSYGGYAALQSGVLDPDLFKAIVAVAPVTDLIKLRQSAMNFSNYRAVQNFVGEGPHLQEGSPAQNARQIKAPVLMFHGDYDQNVPISHSREMEGSLKGAGKQVTYVEFPNLGHSLESGDARARMLSESDAFIRQALGLAAD